TRPTARGTREPDAAVRLRAAFTALRDLPGRLSGTALGSEVAPWSEGLARHGEAGTTALDMLDAQRTGDAAAAWSADRKLGARRKTAAAARVTVGEGVLDPFLSRAQRAYESWAGLDREPPAGGGPDLGLPRARPIDTVTVLTEP
ncbi:hyaluronidase, partial [Streptomyces pilosus]